MKELSVLDKPVELVERDVEWENLVRFATKLDAGAALGLVYGRRRQGKTFMLELLAEATGGLMFTASEQYGPGNLEALSQAYRDFVQTGEPVRFADWEEAIDALMRLGERGDKPVLVVLDEFPHLLLDQPALPSLIQIAMSPRSRAMRQSRTRLILCGSALTTMRKLLGGSAPLRGRATLELAVAPLGYREAAQFWGLAGNPDLAFRVNALAGGTPAYLAMSDGPVKSERDFVPWVLRGLLNPASAMFREGNILLQEQPEVTDAALYFSVLQAIATGAARRSEIAVRLGRPDSALAHPLTVLEEIRLAEKVEDGLVERRPIYRLTEPVIRLHHLLMRRHEPQLVALGGRDVWLSHQDTVEAKIYGPHFEDIAREWTLKYAPPDLLGWPNQVRPAVIACMEHGHSHEIDVVATIDVAYEPKRIVALGEAKGTSSPVGVAELIRLDHLRGLIPQDKLASEVKLLLFGRAGFSVELRKQAAARSEVELVDISRLYAGA
ncbi:AAA family ATPase [Catelliglobosispora koreensis]|uniref:AAA family ATPase n=1 Tax=Catelliglobosispora koreensis TaxID=129052 RepID=UPI00035CAEAD|nr:ATP-binding protein [Catelliglobosispora koreensis]